MYVIQNFEKFQVCAVIQKTSDSGIMSNERLLVIKSGILYYHSKVPSGFNSNNAEELKSISSLTNIPKCSIFTPYLKTIKVDAKSPMELTLTFLAKDLKNKEQLTKRAETVVPYQLFEKQKQKQKNSKADNKTIEWRVKFSSSQKCKQWSKYLEQLKEHYKKLEQQENEMYEKFLQDFNEDKKKVNDQRRSLAVSSVTRPPVSPGNRSTHFPTDGLGTSALAGIVEVEQERLSETSSSKLNDIKRKNSKKQAISDYLNNNLFDGDKPKDTAKDKEKQKVSQQDNKSKIQQQKKKQKDRQDKMKEINLMEKEMKERAQVKDKKQVQSFKWRDSYDDDKPPAKTQKELEQQRLRQQQQQKRRKKQQQQQEQRERLKIIEFARKRQRERVERQKREQEQEQRSKKQSQERQRREEQERAQRKQQIQVDEVVEEQPSQPVFEVTENMLDSQTQKSLQMKQSWKNNHGHSVPEIPHQVVISFNPIKSIELPLQLLKQFKTPAKVLKKQKVRSERKKSAIQNIQQINFLSYVDYQQELFKDKFQQKIKKQTEFLKYIVKLREQAKDIFERIVNSLNNPIESRQFKITGKTYISDRVTIEFAFCETKTIALYQGQRTLYDESGFKTLKQKFMIYNQLQSNILQCLKKKQRICLRVPFYVLLEYRGVMGLVMMNDFLLDSESIVLEQASSQLLTEAGLIIATHRMHNFKLTKIFSTNKYILEVATIFPQQHLEEEKYVLNLSKAIDLSRKQRLPSLEKTKDLLEKKNQLQIQQAQNLELLLYTYHVRSLYRSGQGELDGKDFFSLILSLNSEYSKLLGSSCPSKYPLKGLFCEYINQICGVSIELSQLSGKQQLLAGNIESVLYHTITQMYSFPHLQIFSLMDGFQQFADKQFGKDILKLWKIYSEKDNTLDQIFALFKVISFIKTNRKHEAIEQIQILLDSLRYTHPFKLKCFELLLIHYHSTTNISQFSDCFYKAMNYVDFTFGNHSIILVTLYCILGQFLNQHGQSQQALNFYNIVISKTTNSKVLTEMQIDRSNIYLNMTNKQTITEILSFTLSQLNKRDGMAKMKLMKFLAHLYNMSGKQTEAMDYIQQAIQYFQTNNSKDQLIECYILSSEIWYNNLTKLKQNITKAYEIVKADNSYAGRLSELIKKFMMRLSTRANIEISYLKCGVPKSEQFETIVSRINVNIVDYIQQIFNKITENQSSEEISEFLQFVFN